MKKMTLKQLIEDVNKHIVDNTNIKNGKAEKHGDFFTDSDARNKLVEMTGSHALHKYIPHTDRGNTIYLKGAGITLFLKRKRIEFQVNTWRSSSAMMVTEIQVKEDTNNLAGKTLDVILGFIKDKRDRANKAKQNKEAQEVKDFNTSLTDAGITLEQFYAMQEQYKHLSYGIKKYFESEVE